MNADRTQQFLQMILICIFYGMPPCDLAARAVVLSQGVFTRPSRAYSTHLLRTPAGACALISLEVAATPF